MRSKKTFFSLAVYVSCLLAVFSGALVASFSSGTVAKAAGFDPGTLVSDAFFTMSSAMSVADIQSFLVAKGSVLAVEDPANLGEGAGGRSAAQIIYDATRGTRTDFARSDGYGVNNPLVITLNPAVILVTLQKEQSLITGGYVAGSPATLAALQSAMGYGCPDSGGCSSTYAGFTNQVVYAAAQFVRNSYKAGTSSFQPGATYTIFNTTGPPYNAPVSQSVTIGNAATSSLYQYTPHVYNGNYNFWYYVNLWFSGLGYNPPLALDPSDGSVYVIDDGGRWPITAAGFTQWGFSTANIHTITDQEKAFSIRATLTELPMTEDGSVYYMDGGKKRPFASPRILDNSGVNKAHISPVPTSLMDKIPFGLPMYALLMQTGGDGTVYLVTAGTQYPISGDIFNNAWVFNGREAAQVPAYALQNIPVGPLLSRLVRMDGGDGTVYLMDRGIAYPVSAAMAVAWQLDLSKTRLIGSTVLFEHANGGLLTNLVRQSDGDGTVYVVTGGQKQPLTAHAWAVRGYSSAQVKLMSASVLNTLPTGAVVR